MKAAARRKHATMYRSINELARQAFEAGNIREMDRYLDARNDIGSALREASHAEWHALHAIRFSPPVLTPTAR